MRCSPWIQNAVAPIEPRGAKDSRQTAPPELRLWLASFRCMTNFVFDPPLRLARDVTVRTLDDAAEFARTFVGPLTLPPTFIQRQLETAGHAFCRTVACLSRLSPCAGRQGSAQ